VSSGQHVVPHGSYNSSSQTHCPFSQVCRSPQQRLLQHFSEQQFRGSEQLCPEFLHLHLCFRLQMSEQQSVSFLHPLPVSEQSVCAAAGRSPSAAAIPDSTPAARVLSARWREREVVAKERVSWSKRSWFIA
jgi:hypothetical protein